MDEQRMMLRFSSLYERFRGSLFYVPALYVVIAGIGAWVASNFDREYARELPHIPILLSTTVTSARSVLSTIAGATITVAGVMFSLTVIAVQLASSQFSPRVLRGLLRDRVSQHTIGITVATFTYCLLVLAGTRIGGVDAIGEEPLQNVSVTAAVALSLAAVLAIVAFLDHSARSMQVGEVIRRIAKETHEAARRRFPEHGESDPVSRPEPPGRAPDLVVRSEREGWVQLIDMTAILDVLPSGSIGRVATRAGAFVIEGRPLVELWGEVDEPDDLVRALQRRFVIGDGRTMKQDVMFGVRQLVDIGLRALSPGINDPTTAIEVLYRLGGIVRELALRDLFLGGLEDPEKDRALVQGDVLDLDDVVRYSFRQLRVVATSQPGVLKMLVRVLGEVTVELRRHGLDERIGPFREEARLALRALESHGHITEDVTPVRREAERYGLV